jgi:hypothetical protein
MIRKKDAQRLASLLDGVTKGGTIEWFSAKEGKWLPETSLEGLISAGNTKRRVNYSKGAGKPFRGVYGDDWQKLVNYSAAALNGDCPLLDDLVVVMADVYMAELEARNAELELRIAKMIMEAE